MSFKSILVTSLLLVTGVFVQAMQQDQDTIHNAAKRGDVEVVQQFINQDQDGKLINQQNNGSCTALHRAAENGHEEVVRLLLAHPNIQINQQDTIMGWSPLHCAAYNWHEGVVRLLLTHPNIQINQQNKDGATPLFYAATWGRHEKIIRLLLLHGADPRISERNGNTPLQHPIVQKILAEIREHVRTEQRTVLMGLHSRAGAASSLQAIQYNIGQILTYLQPEFFPAVRPAVPVATPTMIQRVLAAAQNMIDNPRFLAAITAEFATLCLFKR